MTTWTIDPPCVTEFVELVGAHRSRSEPNTPRSYALHNSENRSADLELASQEELSSAIISESPSEPGSGRRA